MSDLQMVDDSIYLEVFVDDYTGMQHSVNSTVCL